MKLTPNIAQSIVDRTIPLLKHNINIMNEKGTIIGSGDSSRIGAHHQGAERVLKETRTVEIRKGNPEQLTGSREGVNLPICFDEKVAGVVGITGDPEEVRIYAAMVQVMAELMLEEAFFWEKTSIEEQARFALINDLIRRDPGKDSNALRTRANLAGYNLELSRVAVVFEVRSQSKLQEQLSTIKQLGSKSMLDQRFKKQAQKIKESLSLKSQDLFAAGIGDRFVILKHLEGKESLSTQSLLKGLFDNFESTNFQITAGVGKRCFAFEEIPDSFDQALQALEVGQSLFGADQVYYIEELGLEKFIAKVGKEFRQNFFREILQELFSGKNSSRQLLETAEAFLRHDLKPGETAQKLFIHRNTLSYRLNKIKEKTGLNLYDLEDVLKFKMALLCGQFDREIDM